jgi:uncharacterized protein
VKFSQHNASSANIVRRYSAASIWVGEQELTASCLVSADRIVTDWPPRSVAEFEPPHLQAVFDLDPEVVALATGATAQFPRAAIRAEFGARRIGLEVMALGAACRTYNVLIAEGRRAVIAVLF